MTGIYTKEITNQFFLANTSMIPEKRKMPELVSITGINKYTKKVFKDLCDLIQLAKYTFWYDKLSSMLNSYFVPKNLAFCNREEFYKIRQIIKESIC